MKKNKSFPIQWVIVGIITLGIMAATAFLFFIYQENNKPEILPTLIVVDLITPIPDALLQKKFVTSNLDPNT